MENNFDIQKIKNEIKMIKLEILQKEEKVDEILRLLNNQEDCVEDIEESY